MHNPRVIFFSVAFTLLVGGYLLLDALVLSNSHRATAVETFFYELKQYATLDSGSLFVDGSSSSSSSSGPVLLDSELGRASFQDAKYSPFRADSLLSSLQHVVQRAPGSHLACFKHSNQEERMYYLAADTFAACYVEDLCWDMEGGAGAPSFTAPQQRDVNDSDEGVAGWPWGGEVRLRHRDMTVSVLPREPGPLPYPVEANTSLTVFWTPFASDNPYHELVEFASSVFATAFNSMEGYYDPRELRFDRDLRIVLLSPCTTGAPFEKDIIGALSRYPVRVITELNQSVCFKRVWFGLPFFVRADSRYELRYSPFKARPDLVRMLFSRNIARRMLEDRYDRQQKLKQRQPAVHDLADLKAVVNHLAQEERDLFWPLIKWPKGTLVVLIERVNKRRVKNFADLVERCQQEFGSRGYKVVSAQLENMSVQDQILLTSRATVMVGPHGAGLSHLMWMQPSSVLLELRPAHNNRCFFQFLASDHQITYLLYQPQRLLKTLNKVGLGGSEDINGDFEVEVDVVVEQMKFALSLSDQNFGISSECTQPITTEEALRAAAAVQGIHQNTAHREVTRK